MKTERLVKLFRSLNLKKKQKMGKNYIRMVFWNANGLSCKIEKFKTHLTEENIGIALVHETHLRPNTKKNNTQLQLLQEG